MKKATALLSLMSTMLLAGCHVVVPAKPIDSGFVPGTRFGVPVDPVAQAPQPLQAATTVAERDLHEPAISGDARGVTPATSVSVAEHSARHVSGVSARAAPVPATAPQYAYIQRDLPSYLWEGAMMALRLCASSGRC